MRGMQRRFISHVRSNLLQVRQRFFGVSCLRQPLDNTSCRSSCGQRKYHSQPFFRPEGLLGLGINTHVKCSLKAYGQYLPRYQRNDQHRQTPIHKRGTWGQVTSNYIARLVRLLLSTTSSHSFFPRSFSTQETVHRPLVGPKKCIWHFDSVTVIVGYLEWQDSQHYPMTLLCSFYYSSPTTVSSISQPCHELSIDLRLLSSTDTFTYGKALGFILRTMSDAEFRAGVDTTT